MQPSHSREGLDIGRIRKDIERRQRLEHGKLLKIVLATAAVTAAVVQVANFVLGG